MTNSGATGGIEDVPEGHPTEQSIQAIRDLFEKSAHFLIVSHIRPDGDAIGATLGLGLALLQAGKDVCMALVDGIPANLRYLDGAKLIKRSPGDVSHYDCVIVVDCSDLLRTGGVLGSRVPDLNIDHHITNLNFAHLNFVFPEQVATSAIIAQYVPRWGLKYNRSIAAALLTGIVTDTIGFRTSNITPEALRLSAMLMEQGANLPDLYARALASKTYEAARYWGYGLGKLQKDDNLVWTTLTLADREGADYSGNDDADLVNVLSSINSDVAIIFVEQKNGHVKVSWRSRPGIDVSQIALQFGGGGHAAAAGADISGFLDTIQEQVLTKTREFISRAGKNGPNGKV